MHITFKNKQETTTVNRLVYLEKLNKNIKTKYFKRKQEIQSLQHKLELLRIQNMSFKGFNRQKVKQKYEV